MFRIQKKTVTTRHVPTTQITGEKQMSAQSSPFEGLGDPDVSTLAQRRRASEYEKWAVGPIGLIIISLLMGAALGILIYRAIVLERIRSFREDLPALMKESLKEEAARRNRN